MKVFGDNTYRLQSSNKHLLNVFEENYFLELGVVDLSLLSQLMRGEILNLSDFIYSEITSDGIGKIINNYSKDDEIQLAYLLQIRQRNSSYQLFLTCGSLKYLNENLQEVFAPIILIPVEIDAISRKIVKTSSVIVNHLLLQKLLNENNENYKRYVNEKITTVAQIDLFCDDLAKRFNTSFSVENYLTFGKIEYSDFIVPHGFFDVERSLFNVDVISVYREFYENIKAVLPSNVFQKRVILKASKGENIAIDSRFGSGKTSTAINILADQIAKGKKVLYINESIENIYEIEKRLLHLGLGKFFYNLVRILPQKEVLPLDLDIVEENVNYNDILDKILSYKSSLDEKTHGYSYRFLLEQIASIKNQFPNIEPIEIEIDLERFEIEKVYQTLKEVEDAFTKITPYVQNVWRKIENFYTYDHIPEIMEVTKNFEDIQNKMFIFMNNFCDDYSIRFPENIRSVHRLTLTLRNFMITPPPMNWAESFNYEEAHQAINQITAWQDKQFELSNYYQTNINSTYLTGTAEKILNKLYQNFYTKHDSLYLERLLEAKAPLLRIVHNNAMHRRIILQLQEEIKDVFALKSIPDYLFPFLESMDSFYHNNETIPLWINKYLNHDSNFEKRVKAIYRRIKKLSNSLSSMLIKPEELQYQSLSILVNHKNFRKLLLRMTKKTVIRQNDFEKVLLKVQQLYKRSSQLNELIGYDDSCAIIPEKLWIYCLNWFDFCKSLKDKENRIFQSLLTSDYFQRFEKKFLTTIHRFILEIKYFENNFEQLEEYNITIPNGNIFDRIINYEPWEKYLKDVIEIKTKLKNIFQKKNISYRDLLELYQKDIDSKSLEESTHKYKNAFQKLFGKHYKGVNTDCTSISKLVNHFDAFLDRLEDNGMLNSLLEEKMMERMTNEYNTMNGLYEKWIVHYRNFSRYFHGGEPLFYDVSLKDGLEIIHNYVKKIGQLAIMLKMIKFHKYYSELGLENLAEGIRSSKYFENIGVKYLYSTYIRIKELFEEDHPNLLEGNEILTLFERVEQFENNYLIKNISSFIGEDVNERRLKAKVESLPFHKYNRLIEAIDRHKSCYLADINIFNSGLDVKQFDLVIVDDGHLSTSNKYFRLNECNQVVVFGDSAFRSSISNSLMKRIDKAALINLPYRYIYHNSQFGDYLGIQNQYIYDFLAKYEINGFSNFSDFANKIVSFYNKNTSYTTNIIVTSEHSRRLIYSEIAEKLKSHYETDEIIDILNTQIHIINASFEGMGFVDEVFFYYHDFEKLDSLTQELILKNFTIVKSKISFFYLKSKIPEDDDALKMKIRSFFGQNNYSIKGLRGISSILLDKLKERQIKAESGYGFLEIIIRGKRPIGIIVFERDDKRIPLLIDEYSYYYKQFLERNWYIKIFFTSDLLKDLDSVIDHFLSEISNIL